MNRREILARKLHSDTHADGGATYYFGGAVPLDQPAGFIVGGAAGLSVVVPVSAGWEAYEKALKALEAVTDTPIAFVGTWIEGDHVYIDSVNHYRFLEDAVKVGRDRGEIAYYDVAMQTSYPL